MALPQFPLLQPRVTPRVLRASAGQTYEVMRRWFFGPVVWTSAMAWSGPGPFTPDGVRVVLGAADMDAAGTFDLSGEGVAVTGAGFIGTGSWTESGIGVYFGTISMPGVGAMEWRDPLPFADRYWKGSLRDYSSPSPGRTTKRDLVSLVLPTEADIVKE